MANNPYVNKVVYGDQTVMDISDSTASESDVAAGEVFYKGTGERSVGTGNYYSPTDATSTDIDDADYIPFYDNSASAKKNSLWSNIKAKLNEIFFRRSENNILGAKNLLPYPYGSGTSATSGGVSYSVDADGIVTATNSATGESTFFLVGTTWGYANYIDADKILKPNTEYTLTAGIENDSNIYVHAILANSSGTNVTVWRTRADSEKTQRTPADLTGLRLACWIRINANTTISSPIKFYPMLRLTTDADETYAPFAMTNKQLTDNKFSYVDNGILGAKNIMPNNLVAETSDVVTYTRNSDDSVMIDTGGSASTVVTYCDMIPNNPHTTSWHPLSDFPTLKKCCEEGRTITLSGSDDVNVRVTLAIRKGTSSQDFEIQCQGNEVSGQLPSDDLDNRYVYYYLRVASGTTLSNKKVYPMVRLATDTDSGFEPFAMTNKELTDKFGTLGSASTKDVPASGDAGQTEVVLGSDSRLTDARTPTSHTHTTSQITDFPTLAAVATSGSYSDLTGTPTIPDELADLSDDSTHRLVTDTEKSTWNNKCDNSVIAPVENGETASQAYAIGEHFIRDGAFCTAKTAIALGAAFTLNTNYTAGDIADRLSDKVESTTLSSSTGNISSCGTLRAVACKGLRLGMLIWSGNSTTPSGGTDNNYDFTLPADYKPLYACGSPLRNDVTGAGLQVRTDGKARLTVTRSWSSATVTYFLE